MRNEEYGVRNGASPEKEEAVKGFAHFLIDKAESGGVIHISDIPDYVVEFLEKSDGGGKKHA